jgi:hypothetical protein
VQSLTGAVTSAEEGAMEAVPVSAQAAGSSIKEWGVPPPHTDPFSVRCFMDENGELWSGGMASDRMLRIYPQSEHRSYISCRS